MCNEKMVEVKFPNLIDSNTGQPVVVTVPEATMTPERINELWFAAERAKKTAETLKEGKSPYGITEGKTRANTKVKTESIWTKIAKLVSTIVAKIRSLKPEKKVIRPTEKKIPAVGEVWKEKYEAPWDCASCVVTNVHPDWVQFQFLQQRMEQWSMAAAPKKITVKMSSFLFKFEFTGETREVPKKFGEEVVKPEAPTGRVIAEGQDPAG